MKKLILVLVLISTAFFFGCGGPSSGKVLVKINGDKITEGDIKFLGEINPRIQMQINSPDGLKRILDNLVEQELMYQEAIKEGINRDSKVKAKIDLYRKVIIAQSLVENAAEKAAKKYYDANQDEFKKLKLSDITIRFASPDEMKNAKKGDKVRSEPEALKVAQEAKARIDKGEDFAKVAQEMSDDQPSKSRGGDLGTVSKNDKRLEPRGMGPVLEKAFELKVGEVAGPIKTDKGYHIITVTRGVELEPFDEAKQSVLMRTGNESRTELLAKLKKDSKIVYPEQEKQATDAKKKAEAEANKAGAAKPAEAKPEATAPAKPAAPEAAAPATDVKK